MERLTPQSAQTAPFKADNAGCAFIPDLRSGCFTPLSASSLRLINEKQRFFRASARCYQALLGTEPILDRQHTLSLYDRLSAALTVAQVTQIQPLCAFYAALLAPLDYPHNTREGNHRLTQLTQHARLLAWEPTRISEQNIAALRRVRLTLSDIVTLSQIVGFVSLQARMVAVSAALNATLLPAALAELPVSAIVTPPADVPAFAWRPFLPLSALAEYRPLPVCGAPEGLAFALMLLKMHDADAMETCQTLFSEGFNCNERVRQPLRELAFLLSARVTQCPRSAQHHLTRYLLLSKHRTQAEALYADPVAAAAEHCNRREQAIVDACLTLAQTPVRFSVEHVAALTRAGLDAAESLELLIATATAAWTQRLLISLGE